MSVESLCHGDTVVVQTETTTRGASFGNSFAYTDGDSIDCLIQSVSASESLKYADRGMMFTDRAFFSSDPGLTNQNRLKQTVQGGVTLATPRLLRVLATNADGRPGEDMVWFADLSFEPTRRET